jgi:DNA-binding CsgD family transcriptional regulator
VLMPIPPTVLRRASEVDEESRRILRGLCTGKEIAGIQDEVRLTRRQANQRLDLIVEVVGARNRAHAAALAPILRIVSPEAVIGSLTRTPADLTERRLSMVRLLVRGASNPEIATELEINVTSVSKPLGDIHEHLGTLSREHLAAAAVVLKLVPLSSVLSSLPDRFWTSTDADQPAGHHPPVSAKT